MEQDNQLSLFDVFNLNIFRDGSSKELSISNMTNDLGNKTSSEDTSNTDKFKVECEVDSELPYLNLDNCLSKIKQHGKKSRKKNSKTNTDININSVKTMVESKENKEKGIGTLNITGVGDKKAAEFIKQVANKNKNELDTKNKELLRTVEFPYIKRKSLLTDAEKKLYNILIKRLPSDKVVIFSKVRLADIVDVNDVITRDSIAFRKIAYKHVDFVILSVDTLELICAVELDDYTHDTEQGKQRDTFVEGVLRQCGIQLYRIKTKIDYVTNEDTKPIEMWVLQFLAPTCPICGRPMEPKESKRKSNYGHRFYGCMGFYEPGDKQCRYTIDID